MTTEPTRPPPTTETPAMHLDPITPVDTDDHPGDLPMRHGAVGSPARLAVLLYLANRPRGATHKTLRELTGLDEDDILLVLRGLQRDHRIVCGAYGPGAMWYVPAARAGLRRDQVDELEPTGPSADDATASAIAAALTATATQGLV